MELSRQIVNLKPAQKLKELGFMQDSLFYCNTVAYLFLL